MRGSPTLWPVSASTRNGSAVFASTCSRSNRSFSRIWFAKPRNSAGSVPGFKGTHSLAFAAVALKRGSKQMIRVPASMASKNARDHIMPVSTTLQLTIKTVLACGHSQMVFFANMPSQPNAWP